MLRAWHYSERFPDPASKERIIALGHAVQAKPMAAKAGVLAAQRSQCAWAGIYLQGVQAAQHPQHPAIRLSSSSSLSCTDRNTFCATKCERVRVYPAQHQAVDAALVGCLQSPQWEQPSWPSSGQLAASWQAAPRQHARHPGVRRPHQLPLDWRQVAITCLTCNTGDSLRETESHLSKGSLSVLLRACRLSIGGLCLAGVAFVLQTYMV